MQTCGGQCNVEGNGGMVWSCLMSFWIANRTWNAQPSQNHNLSIAYPFPAAATGHVYVRMGASPLQECLALDDFPTFVHVHHLGMHHMSRAKCVVGQMGLAIRAIWSTFSHWLSLGCSVKFFLEQWFQDPNVEWEDDGTDGTWKGKDAAFMWGAPMTLYYKKCLYKSAWLKLLQYWSHSAPLPSYLDLCQIISFNHSFVFCSDTVMLL